MYSILLSSFEKGIDVVKEELKKIIKKDFNVVVIPWSFAIELKSKNIKEFFNEDKENKYLGELKELGIKDENIKVLDCYNDSKEYMIDSINNSSMILFTGGNPEMLYKKVEEAGLINYIKDYKKIVIGSSAGAELQLKKYFITKKNNYYKKFCFYEGFGIIKEEFYFDVHSVNRGRYLPSLEKKSKDLKKNIYCIFDTGAIIYNRDTKELNCYGDVIKYENEV